MKNEILTHKRDFYYCFHPKGLSTDSSSAGRLLQSTKPTGANRWESRSLRNLLISVLAWLLFFVAALLRFLFPLTILILIFLLSSIVSHHAANSRPVSHSITAVDGISKHGIATISSSVESRRRSQSCLCHGLEQEDVLPQEERIILQGCAGLSLPICPFLGQF